MSPAKTSWIIPTLIVLLLALSGTPPATAAKRNARLATGDSDTVFVGNPRTCEDGYALFHYFRKLDKMAWVNYGEPKYQTRIMDSLLRNRYHIVPIRLGCTKPEWADCVNDSMRPYIVAAYGKDFFTRILTETKALQK